MKCEEYRESFIESSLPAETQAHVSSCAACAQAWAEHQKVFALLDEWKAPEVSPFFDTRLKALVREAKAEEANAGAFGWLRKPFFGMPVWRPAAAGALAIALAAGIGVMRNSQVENRPIQVAGTAVSDIQQLDKHEDEISNLDLLDDLNAADNGSDTEDEL